MHDKIREVKFNRQTLKFVYRGDSDLSVIDEFFVDHMYRSTEFSILNSQFSILDIGAHIGVFSLYSSILLGLSDSRRQSSHLTGGQTILALEPEPDNFKLLKANLKLNNIKNVTPVQSALITGKESNTKLYLSKNTHNHSTIRHGSLQGDSVEPGQAIQVPAINLEQLMKEHKIKTIGLLKMDIEGAEFEIISNMQYPIFNHIQNIVVEYHESQQNKRSELEKFIRSHGFSVEHFPNKFDKRFGLLVCKNKR